MAKETVYNLGVKIWAEKSNESPFFVVYKYSEEDPIDLNMARNIAQGIVAKNVLGGYAVTVLSNNSSLPHHMIQLLVSDAAEEGGW